MLPFQENLVRNRQPLQFYNEPLPGVDASDLLGKLIVIEGTDGVGRSTHIGLLKQWLDEHLPQMVEEHVKREISRITGRPL